MSVNTKLTNLANEIREISGTTTKKSLDVMASDISAANDLIDEQEELIAQLQAAVDSLPEAGGGGGSLETCTVSLEIDGPIMMDSLVYYTNESQELATETFRSSITIKCLKNSIISTNNGGTGVKTSGSLEVLYRLGGCLVLHVFGDGNVVIGL